MKVICLRSFIIVFCLSIFCHNQLSSQQDDFFIEKYAQYIHLFSVAHNTDIDKVTEQMLRYNIKKGSQIVFLMEIPKRKIDDYKSIIDRLQELSRKFEEIYGDSSYFKIKMNAYFNNDINFHKIHIYLMK